MKGLEAACPEELLIASSNIVGEMGAYELKRKYAGTEEDDEDGTLQTELSFEELEGGEFGAVSVWGCVSCARSAELSGDTGD